ncbi:MAG: hypothetical protein ACK4RK_01485 [Gemmataceae bacterium]
MLSAESLHELKTYWLPNVSDAGLERLIDLLEKGSPLLIHGSFTKTVPMGCLATQIGWNHPRTCHLTYDAGITWLHRVAGLNPAASHVIREWDMWGAHRWEIRAELLALFQEERQARQQPVLPPCPAEELVEV